MSFPLTQDTTCKLVTNRNPQLTVELSPDSDDGFGVWISSLREQCETRCTDVVTLNSEVELIASGIGDVGESFTIMWDGDCEGTSPTVTVQMDRDKHCIARIKRDTCDEGTFPTLDINVSATRGGAPVMLNVDRTDMLWQIDVRAGDILVLDASESLPNSPGLLGFEWSIAGEVLYGNVISVPITWRPGQSVGGRVTGTNQCFYETTQEFIVNILF